MMTPASPKYSFIEYLIGFTLLGLSIGIAVPVYNDYTKHARVSEMMSIAHAAKLAVSDYFLIHKSFPNEQAISNQIHHLNSPVIEKIAISDNGTITLAANPVQLGASMNMVLTPSGDSNGVTWTCRATGQELRMIPASCR